MPHAFYWRSASARAQWLGVAGACLLFCLAWTSAAWASPSYTWSGEAATGQTTTNNWSNAANWSGGVAPAASATIGTLSFPSLESVAACKQIPPTEACNLSHNDLAGLSVEALQVSLDRYVLSGEAITLGSGGLSATAAWANGSAIIKFPVALGASQTWSIAGETGGAVGATGVIMEAPLTGSSSVLTLDTSNGSGLGLFSSSAEVGSVTVTGADARRNGETAPLNGGVEMLSGASLNASDGNPVTLNHAALLTDGQVTVGPLTSNGGFIEAKPVFPTPQGVDGQISTSSLTLDAASDLVLRVQPDENTVPVHSSRITSTGGVRLNDATLTVITGGDSTNQCAPPLEVGHVFTLVSTTDTLEGSFGNVGEDGVVPVVQPLQTLGCAPQLLEISYAHENDPTKTITGTVLGNVPVATSPPTIAGTTRQGQTLTETPGTWTNQPTSSTVQWLRCNSAEACTPITGATGQSYTLSEADVSYTIRVQETASNAEGAGPPATSAATSMVTALRPGNTVLPTITGEAVQGQTLTETHGSWTNKPEVYEYLWLRCDSAGENCAPIEGASSQSYVLTAADVGHTIRVAEGATNGGGTTIATSAATAVITAASAEKPSEGTSTASTTSTSSKTSSGSSPGTSSSSVASGSPAVTARPLATVSAGAASLVVTCQSTNTCTGTVKLTVQITERRVVIRHGHRRVIRRKRTIVIGTSSFQVAADKTSSLHIHLTRKGQALLRKAGTRGLKATLSGSHITTHAVTLKSGKVRSRASGRRSAHAAARQHRIHQPTCQQQFSHNAKARAVCIKNSPSTHGKCSLKEDWSITSGRAVEPSGRKSGSPTRPFSIGNSKSR